MGGRASLDGHRFGLHLEILALRCQGRHGGEAGLDKHRPGLISKSLLYGAKDVMEARQAWMLERIRLNCVSECEHHQGAGERSPEAIEMTGLCAASRKRLNLILSSGTVMP